MVMRMYTIRMTTHLGEKNADPEKNIAPAG